MSLFIDSKYVSLISTRLQKFTKRRDNLYTFRCPYCGDSKKNPNKTRGFFYKEKNDLYFKCHNCDRGTTLYNFLKDWDPSLCREYQIERFKNGENGYSNYPKPKVEETNYSLTQFVKHALLSGIDAISDLSSEHYARQYLENRLIPTSFFSNLFYTDDFKDLIDTVEPDNEYLLKKNDPRIVIPFFDKIGEVLAVQGRALKDNKLRYITIKLKKNAPKIFGLDRLDTSETVYVVEGPFDSLFIPNCIAAAGSDLPEFKDAVYIYDNQPRNREVVSKISKLIPDNKVVIWPENIEEKDINDLILSGRTPKEVKELIDSNTFSGLKAKIKFNAWKKI